MPKKQTSHEPTFEQVFAELEEIVARLDSADLSLDDSLALFEKGQTLAAQCAKLLEAAELKVKQLSPDGEIVDFEPQED